MRQLQNIKIPTCFSILLFLINFCSAQKVLSAPDDYYVQHYGEGDGLVQNSITAILPDNNGFLWIGTEAGITRFNGNRFFYLPIKNNSSSNNFTRPITLCYKGKDTIIAFSPYSQKVAIIANNKIINVEEQRIEKQGLFFRNQNYTLPAPGYINGTNYISSYLSKEQWNLDRFGLIGAVHNKDTFMVVVNDGIGVYDNKGIVNKIKIPGVDAGRMLFINHHVIYIDKNNYANYYTPLGGFQKKVALQILGKNNLVFFNNGLENNSFCIANNVLYSITVAGEGKLHISPLINYLQNAKNVSAVYQKDSNTIVVGTNDDGLYVYKKKYFSMTEPLANGESNDFYTQQLMPDNKTVFTGKGKLFRQDKYIGTVADFPALTHTSLRDRKGYYWYPSIKSKSIIRTRDLRILGDTIIRFKGIVPDIFLEDKMGKIWVGTGTEFGYVEQDKFMEVHIKNIRTWTITGMVQDAVGKYIIGTNQGLFIWNNKDDSTAKPIVGLETCDIRYLWAESNGRVWICTYGNGLFLLTNESLTSFPENKGKLSYVGSIVEDSNGYVWLPSSNGLFLTTKQSLLQYAQNKDSHIYFYKFSTNNGLRTNEFNNRLLPAYLRLFGGDISIASIKGLVRFNPSQIKLAFSSSPLLIESIQLDSTEIETDDSFDINENVKNIHFTLFSSNWGDKENEILEYQVVQKDATPQQDEWEMVDQSGRISLFSPSHGNYKLLIRKRNGFGENDYVNKIINFRVLPKWYQTNEFEFGRLLSSIGVLVGIFFWRRRYYRRANLKLKEKVNAATLELQQLNNTLEKKVVERTKAVQEAEKKFRTLVEGSLVGVYIAKDGKLVYVNPRFAEIFGYTQHELINAPTLDIIVYEPDREMVARNIRERMEGTIEGVQYELRGQKKDGTIIHIEVFGRTTEFEGEPGLIGSLIDITEKKILEKEVLAQKAQEQKITIRSILLGEEKERNKIGQELHDNINQILAGTRLYLNTAKKRSAEEEKSIIIESIKLIDSAIEEIRALSKNKVTPAKKGDLHEMLQSLIEQMAANNNKKAKLIFDASGVLIDDDLKLNIYRIIQEQLNNIIKHARAKNVTVLIEADNGDILVSICDDGKGFDTAAKKNGIGLANMINRVESFNGTINIESSPGNGCTITIALPL